VKKKNYRKKRNSGSGYVFDKTVKQGLERKVVDFEQAKLLRESSGKNWRIFLCKVSEKLKVSLLIMFV
jgi:hypothetical protein